MSSAARVEFWMAATVVWPAAETRVPVGKAVITGGWEEDDEDEEHVDDEAVEREEGDALARLQSIDVEEVVPPTTELGVKVIAPPTGWGMRVALTAGRECCGPVGDEHDDEPDDELVSCSSRSMSVV